MGEPQYEYSVRLVLKSGLEMDGRVHSSLEEAARVFEATQRNVFDRAHSLVLVRRPVAEWEKVTEFTWAKEGSGGQQ